jgi:alkylation response protein AidB-like acyl-CoA dehydrogenase
MEAFRARFTDGRFVPLGNYAPAHLRDALDEGEIVTVEVARDRSMKSHRHQFAEIREMWDTLPEAMRELPYAASAEALRKHALIVTGYCDVETIDAGTKAAAARIAAYVGDLARKAHGYAIVKVEGPVVRVYTPHSQSVRAMGGRVFQESKTKVLDWIAARMGIARENAA